MRFNKSVDVEQQIIDLLSDFKEGGITPDFIMVGAFELEQIKKYYKEQSRKVEPCATCKEFLTKQRVFGLELVQTFHENDFYII